MRDCSDAPDDDGEAEADAGAKPVDHVSCQQKTGGVGELERKDNVAVVDFAPAELRLQRWLEDPDDLPIDVVDRRGEEQQPTDHPAVVARLRGRRGLRAGAHVDSPE
jgi:hypothetical protein